MSLVDHDWGRPGAHFVLTNDDTSGGNNCPMVWKDETDGSIVLQGWEVTDPLETGDTYTPDDPCYVEWQQTGIIDVDTHWHEWRDEVARTVARGVVMRRARIVSEPVTAFIRYEYELTSPLNIAAGEEVRWLPRSRASDLMLPGNDFWVFDEHLVRFTLFGGDG